MSARKQMDNFFAAATLQGRQEVWRFPSGVHRTKKVQRLEEASIAELELLRDVKRAYPDPSGYEMNLNQVLQEVQGGLNHYEDKLGRLPRQWVMAFRQARSTQEGFMNRYYSGYDVRLGLPWGQETNLPSFKHDKGAWGERLYVEPEERFLPAWINPRRPEPSARLQRVGPDLQENNPTGRAAPVRRAQPVEREGSVRREEPGRAAHVPAASSAPRNDTQRTSGRSTTDNHTTRRQQDRPHRRATGQSNTNAFKISEDPLSRTLQGNKNVTLTNEEGKALYTFTLIYNQQDEQTTALINKINAEADGHHAKTGTEIRKPIDIAMQAIEEETVVQIANSARARGNIWVTRKGCNDVADVLRKLEGGGLGQWALFGVGTRISEGRLFLLQTFGLGR